MKRKFCKGIAIALACSMLAGCGGKGQETGGNKNDAPENSNQAEAGQEESQGGQEESQSGEQEPAGESVNIKWYLYNGDDCPDKEKVQDAINAYIEPLIGVTVTMITRAEEPELTLALASGEDIDLYWTAGWYTGQAFIQDNSCKDLTDYLKDYPGLYNSIPENVWQAAQIGGRNYFVPIYKESATGYSLAYSKDMAEEYGWDFSNVKTFEDLTPFLKDAYEKGATNAWYSWGSLWETYTLDTFSFIGPDKTNRIIGVRRDEGKTIINLTETEEYRKYLDLVYGWNQAGYVNKERAGLDLSDDEVGKMLAEKDIAFVWWSGTPDGEANASIRFKTPIGLTASTNNYLSTDGTFGSAYMVNSRSEKVDACLKFLEILSTDSVVADLACYGIENEHYTRDAEGYVTVVENPGYRTGGVWSICNVMAPSLQAGESADKKEQYAEWNETALVYPSDSFSFDYTDVSAEVAAVGVVYEEYYELMQKGFYNPDTELAKYQQALKDAGIDKIIEAMQVEYDKYIQEYEN